MEDRVEALEVKVAFQEHTITQLDEVVRQLADELERVRRELTELREEHAASLEPPIDEKPPHY